MRFTALIATLLLASPLAADSYRLRVDLPHFAADRSRLLTDGFDVTEEHAAAGWVEVILPERDLPRLAATGLAWRILERSRPLRDILGGPLDLDSRYHTPAEIEADLLAWANAFPTIAARVDLTAELGMPPTWNGQHIYALKISDSVGVDEDEPTVLCVGNHHCREIVTPEAMFDIIERLLTGYGSDPQVTRWVDEKEFWIVPTLNPDGLDYVWNSDNMWRKNRRLNPDGSYGVDLNRNYPFKWAACGNYSTNYSSNVYCGPSALSEPETATLAALARRERFSLVVDDHSYGQEVLYPYACGSMPHQVSSIVQQHMLSAASAASYSYRLASAGGEHFEWEFHEIGGLSYLLEIAVEFQPTWNSSQAELQRVWPAMEHLFDAAIPLSGHITDALTGVPLQADIRLVGVNFTEGETRRSEAGFGRYHFWVGSGTYDVEVSAAGYPTKTVSGVVVDAANGTQLDVGLGTTPPQIWLLGSPRPGNSVFWLTGNALPWVGDTSYILLSGSGGGVAGGFPLPDGSGRNVPLVYDSYTAWALAHPALLSSVIGPAGQGQTASLQIPVSIPPGASFWSAAVLVNPAGGAYDAVSDELLTVIQ